MPGPATPSVLSELTATRWLALAALAALVGWNVVTWATYRLDKARARGSRRRIPERLLLIMAAAGGSIGALLGVYAHRQRHKASKLGFLVPLWAIVALQIAVGVLLALRGR